MPAWQQPHRPRTIAAVIFDVDGVLVASPHERAWQEALFALMESDWKDIAARTSYTPDRFTTAVYQTQVSGKPRMSGARAVLDYFGVPDAERRAVEYAARKQQRIEELIEAGVFVAYADALRFILALRARGFRLAAASSSKNANRFMHQIRLDTFAHHAGLHETPPGPGETLLDIFDANVCGRDLRQGKPDPEIFLLAAAELGVPPAQCAVVEDAAAGVAAAKAGGMAALGIARLDDEALLREEGADLVVTRLDDVSVDALEAGRLERARPKTDRPSQVNISPVGTNRARTGR